MKETKNVQAVEISATTLREIARDHKDVGYHRELHQAANIIEKLQAEVERWKEIAQR
tara:strand:+ start:263 stop:433 length:171 start_codon:yes stop_codon:yes gene_type:complete